MTAINSPRVAALQLTSTNHVEDNLAKCDDLLSKINDQAIDLLVLPETFAFMGFEMREQLQHGEIFGQGKVQTWLSQTAKRLGCTVIGGTVSLLAGNDKTTASSLVYSPDGECIARYDKMHLFDVSIPEANQVYQESAVYTPGSDLTLVTTPVGKIGLSVCYDLRFPALYQQYSSQGAQILCVPSAFTEDTGRAHWEVLLRARAVENQCFVIAPGQVGTHVSGRQTYGHTMIIDPWGTILDCIEHKEGLAMATLDLEKQRALQKSFPVLTHRKAIRATI
jgi:nitrilase